MNFAARRLRVDCAATDSYPETTHAVLIAVVLGALSAIAAAAVKLRLQPAFARWRILTRVGLREWFRLLI